MPQNDFLEVKNICIEKYNLLVKKYYPLATFSKNEET